jgi:hypothetical protein
MNKNKILLLQFSLGIIFALSSAFLMFFDIGPISLRILVGIIGIILIAKSPNILINRDN